MKCHTLPTPRIVVLAAGFSNRLGSPKALARVRGQRLLDRTIDILAPFAARSVIVVIPPGSGRYRTGRHAARLTFAINSHRACGLSSSVRRGITCARYSCAVLLSPVDLVELDRRDIAKLICRWRGARRRVAARDIHGQAATPVIVPRALYRHALAQSGDHGLRELVRRLPRQQVRLVNMPSAQADVDTAVDLQRARRRWRHGT
jgi:molybdenum cofactor cytidylyltransferase